MRKSRKAEREGAKKSAFAKFFVSSRKSEEGLVPVIGESGFSLVGKEEKPPEAAERRLSRIIAVCFTWNHKTSKTNTTLEQLIR